MKVLSVRRIEARAFYSELYNNKLTSVSIFPNVELEGNAFPEEFMNIYMQNNKAGGTYRKSSDNKWRKE